MVNIFRVEKVPVVGGSNWFHCTVWGLNLYTAIESTVAVDSCCNCCSSTGCCCCCGGGSFCRRWSSCAREEQMARLRWPRVGLVPPFTIPWSGGHSGYISDRPFQKTIILFMLSKHLPVERRVHWQTSLQPGFINRCTHMRNAPCGGFVPESDGNSSIATERSPTRQARLKVWTLELFLSKIAYAFRNIRYLIIMLQISYLDLSAWTSFMSSFFCMWALPPTPMSFSIEFMSWATTFLTSSQVHTTLVKRNPFQYLL